MQRPLIRESLYFSFNGINSDEEFDILNVSISTGLFNEPFLPNRTINEVNVPGNEKPYFFGVSKDPKSIQLGFYPQRHWTEEHLSAISRWLDVDEYAPLIFSGMPDKVMNAMPVDSSEAIHNGCGKGYITLTMRLDSPYTYSHEKEDYYDFSQSDVNQIEFRNLGDKSIQPDIYIEKVGDGDITIDNIYEKSEPLSITRLKDGDKISIDPILKLIEISPDNPLIYNNFNHTYLSLSYGISHLQITGRCRLSLQYLSPPKC